MQHEVHEHSVWRNVQSKLLVCVQRIDGAEVVFRTLQAPYVANRLGLALWHHQYEHVGEAFYNRRMA